VSSASARVPARSRCGAVQSCWLSVGGSSFSDAGERLPRQLSRLCEPLGPEGGGDSTSQGQQRAPSRVALGDSQPGWIERGSD
jgi:hypothetical protein